MGAPFKGVNIAAGLKPHFSIVFAHLQPIPVTSKMQRAIGLLQTRVSDTEYVVASRGTHTNWATWNHFHAQFRVYCAHAASQHSVHPRRRRRRRHAIPAFVIFHPSTIIKLMVNSWKISCYHIVYTPRCAKIICPWQIAGRIRCHCSPRSIFDGV